MKKPTLLALLLAAVLLLTGCNLIEIDPEVDARTVLAEVGEQKITKGEAEPVYEMTLASYISLYQSYLQYGMTLFDSEESMIAAAKEDTLNGMAKQIVLKNEFERRGLAFTEEEEKAIEQEAQQTYEDAISTGIESTTTEGSDPEAVRAQVIEQMNAQGYTYEYIAESVRISKIEEKLRADVVKEIAISDEEVSTEYAAKLTEQQESYDATPSQFATDLNGGNLIVYRPEGYRYIKNLLIGMPEDIQTQISEQEDQQYANDYNRYQIESQLSALENVDEATQKSFDDMTAELDSSDAAINAKLEELRAQGKAAVLSKAEEVLALAQAPGADFDALIAEYGEDTGMTVEPAKSNGYPLHEQVTTYVEPFKVAAMALAQPGDISGLVETDYGYHILLYASDIQAGPVPQETVADQIREELLTSKQDELYTAKETEWVDAANVKTYPNRWK